MLRPALLLAAALGCSNGSPATPLPDARAMIDAALAIDVPAVAARVPILLVHGINGAAANFDALKARLVGAGWPVNQVVAHTFASPS